MARHFFSVTYRCSSDHIPSVSVATWLDLGALDAFGRNGNGSLFNESTAVRRFCGIA